MWNAFFIHHSLLHSQKKKFKGTIGFLNMVFQIFEQLQPTTIQSNFCQMSIDMSDFEVERSI
jgi:hypothetical protein